MQRRFPALALCAGLALAAGPACALQSTPVSQAAAPPAIDPQATLVEALVVNARLPGPAWWKVKDADTTVYVLGVPALTTAKLQVDESVFRRRADGANVLILGQEADASVAQLFGLAVGGKRYVRSDQPMRQTLPPALRARLEARLAAIKEQPDSLDEVKPAFAGFMLAAAPDGKVTIHLGGVSDRIRQIARGRDIKKRPRIETLPRYSFVDAIKSLSVAPQPLQELCLDAGLREAESGQGGVKWLSEHWARGEVRDVVLADRGFSRCLASTPSIAKALRDGQADAVRPSPRPCSRPARPWR